MLRGAMDMLLGAANVALFSDSRGHLKPNQKHSHPFLGRLCFIQTSIFWFRWTTRLR